MREVVGDHSVGEVISIGREATGIQAKEQLQKLCDRYGIGFDVQQLVLQNVNPRDAVKPAFNGGVGDRAGDSRSVRHAGPSLPSPSGLSLLMRPTVLLY
jgi:hypothetical protein